MSKIAEQIAQLKKKEKQVEFLTHILESSKKYDHKDFKDVKDEVVALLEKFVKNTIEAIESGVTTTTSEVPAMNVVSSAPKAPEQPNSTAPEQPKSTTPSKPAEMSPADKLNFALNNRNLGGKKVQVINDKNLDLRGEVVGLDAPYVVVKTNTGHIINVPLEKVSVI